MRLTRFVTGLATGLVLCALGCRMAAAAQITVTIDNFAFTPQTVTVHPGDTVVWQNHDDLPHSVVSPGNFRSRALDSDENYSFSFDKVGTMDYFCGLHPHMQGKVVVAP